MRRDQGSSEKMMNDENPTIRGNPSKKGLSGSHLGSTGPLLVQMDGVFNDHLKMIVFGSGLFANDIVNLKHQGAGLKLMIG